MISVIRVGCALAITIAGVAGAAAADLELNAPPPLAPFRAPPPLIFNWTGCYLGGHGGYAYTDRVVTGTILGPIIGGFLVNVADTLPIELPRTELSSAARSAAIISLHDHGSLASRSTRPGRT